MALHINGNVATLADFGLLKAARPVMYRDREIQRKRNARRVERQEREVKALVEAMKQDEAKRLDALTITCANGFKIRPIK